MNNANEFISIDNTIATYLQQTFDSKLNIIRKLCRDVTYNEQYNITVAQSAFLSVIINDIHSIIEQSSSSLVRYNNDNELLTYIRLFCMFTHNELSTDSKYQIMIFNQLFIDNFTLMNNIIINNNKYVSDLKIQKFTLGIIYKLFLLNTHVLTTLLSPNHINFLYDLLLNINYNNINSSSNDNNNNNNDIRDINDWLHIIFEYIIKTSSTCSQLNNITLFTYMLNTVDNEASNNTKLILLIEIIRDVIDYAKDSKILLITLNHIDIIIPLLNKHINILTNIISSNDIITQYQQLQIEYPSFIKSNKMFICFIDILTVLLTTDDRNNKDYQQHIFKSIANDTFYKSLLNLIYISDKLYDDVFKRNKALKVAEKKLIPELPENNLFFGFQSNVMKLIANVGYNNKSMQQYFINNKNDFYALLNHIKIDKCNPLKKEWCVLLIKALCDNCLAIQKMILALEPVDMDPLLKDYIINKGKHNVSFEGSEKEKDIYFSLLTKKDK
jgi:hypothetical protein